MELFNENQSYSVGEIVYVFYRNPHTQVVVNIKSATVVKKPKNTDKLAFFLYETYYPITAEMAIYATEEEVNQAYDYYYGSSSERLS